MNYRCPGQGNLDIKSEIITCLQCGYSIEFFSDEFSLRCPHCRAMQSKERQVSCRDWCKAKHLCRAMGGM